MNRIIKILLLASGGLALQCASRTTSVSPTRESNVAVEESFSAEIRRKHPRIWDLHQVYQQKSTPDCVSEETVTGGARSTGVYHCPIDNNLEMIYDTKTGNFGFQKRF